MSIRVTKDDRTIRTGKHYTEFRKEIYESQGGRCLDCGIPTSLYMEPQYDSSFHVAHRQTRGMGGGFRNDMIGGAKGMVRGGLCGKCHRLEHNS